MVLRAWTRRWIFPCAGAFGALLLAACTSAVSTAPQEPVVTLRTVEQASAIELVITGMGAGQRVKEVVLVAPDGQRTAADTLERETTRAARHGGPYTSVGVSGGSSGRVRSGVRIGFPITSTGGGPARVVTTAHIAIPEPAAYRATVANWTIAMTITDGEEDVTAILPAPN